ncbi:DEAD/DEAH box helicase [Xanthomonas translucens]|uniref:DEAD/DEAH box helicase n=1 Tax=Xanthomonas campestris pv. translucens TaxID=343 RepID=UPI001F616386|nr:DEAD/DEAH box helicase family protein [Xanthomonas translucens]UNU11054.1 DEAD/DEAH box helicase family protein [Xanthomonas translucens pv. translucens]
MSSPFQDVAPRIIGNPKVREPQQGAYEALARHVADGVDIREVSVVLPVGCGKSGTITLTPFAYKSKRALIIAPGLAIAAQLASDFDFSSEKLFYARCDVIDGPNYPEPVEIRGADANRSDLDAAHVAITNIQQVSGDGNKWLRTLPVDYFDLIIFDEGHHSVAATYEALKAKFPTAAIVNFSATPLRADGQMMSGPVVYSYPIFKAIKAGYIKKLKAIQLNPRTLRYVRRPGDSEVEVSLDEVRRLGEEDADFRRSIVTSEETLNTIVDASLRELDRLRNLTGELRLKVIASALNYEHCIQIVEAYRARRRKADFVHSRESKKNNQVMQKLANHQLDVIVQVRKLGEGFDHPFLSVAAVLSVFSNLSPFVQFVGRIMRVIKQDAPGDVVNQGSVIFHAGGNIAARWGDFQQFSKDDQSFFGQLLPLEGLDPADPTESREYAPRDTISDKPEVREQSEVELQEIHLLKGEEEDAIRLLKESGIIPADFDPTTQALKPIAVPKVAKRQAARNALDELIKLHAARILNERGVKHGGRELDRKRLGHDNYVVVVTSLNEAANTLVGRKNGERSEMSQAELDTVRGQFDSLTSTVCRKLFDGN